jgi:hypothetical protein
MMDAHGNSRQVSSHWIQATEYTKTASVKVSIS